MPIVIGCVREHGMIRGGVRHPRGFATHLVGAFTADQLRELVAEPDLVVLVGQPLTPDLIAKIEAERAAGGKAARKGAP